MKINAESTPIRCEICHQSDYFDCLTNTCLRCNNNFSFNKTILYNSKSNNTYFTFNQILFFKGLFIFFINGFISGSMFGYIATISICNKLFYYQQEYLIIPTPIFWSISGLLFLLSLIASYLLIKTTKVLPIYTPKFNIRLLFSILMIICSFSTTYFTSLVSGSLHLLISPIIGAILLSFSMWIFTNLFYTIVRTF